MHKNKLTALKMRLSISCNNTLVYKEYMIRNLFVIKLDTVQLGWFSQIDGMSNKCLVKVLYDREVDKARLKGRSKLVWRDVIEIIFFSRVENQ